MNLGKKYGWDNIPYREVYLSTGEKVGILVDGVRFQEEEKEE